MMNLMQSTEFAATVHVALVGKTASERKLSALDLADDTAIVALSHGTGKLAKQAQELKRDSELHGVALSIANGNFQAFAVKVAGALGENVKFGRKDADGNVVRKAGDDFRAFGGVLEHKLLQLEDKGKVFAASGKYTAAAAEIMYLIGLHGVVVKLMDKREAEIAAKRAQRDAELQLEVQAEKSADVVAA